jgi:hypothetical protein
MPHRGWVLSEGGRSDLTQIEVERSYLFSEGQGWDRQCCLTRCPFSGLSRMLDFGPHMRVPRFIRLKSSPISRRERNPLKQDFLRRALGQGVGRATNASLIGLFMLQLGRAEIEGNHFTAARSSRSIPRSYHIPGGGSENHRQNRWWESSPSTSARTETEQHTSSRRCACARR